MPSSFPIVNILVMYQRWITNYCLNHCMILFHLQIKLADKQAALEKIQWEVMTSNTKIEELQEELKSSRGDVSSFMLFLEGLTKNDSDERVQDYSLSFYLPESSPYIVSTL